jgi:hypothetical protein
VNWLALREAEGLASIFEPWALTVPFDRIKKRKLWRVCECGDDDPERDVPAAYEPRLFGTPSRRPERALRIALDYHQRLRLGRRMRKPLSAVAGRPLH